MSKIDATKVLQVALQHYCDPRIGDHTTDEYLHRMIRDMGGDVASIPQEIQDSVIQWVDKEEWLQ